MIFTKKRWFSLKEQWFSLKELWFSLKKRRFPLQKPWFSPSNYTFPKVDAFTLPGGKARAPLGKLLSPPGRVRASTFWTVESHFQKTTTQHNNTHSRPRGHIHLLKSDHRPTASILDDHYPPRMGKNGHFSKRQSCASPQRGPCPPVYKKFAAALSNAPRNSPPSNASKYPKFWGVIP